MTPGHVATARALIGRGWRHRGRGPVWFDCVGLIVISLQANGIPVEDRQFYGKTPHKDGLRSELRRQFGEPHGEPQVGDIGLFRGTLYPLHVGIFAEHPNGGLSLIHASNEPTLGRVVAHRYVGDWPERFVEAYSVGEF